MSSHKERRATIPPLAQLSERQRRLLVLQEFVCLALFLFLWSVLLLLCYWWVHEGPSFPMILSAWTSRVLLQVPSISLQGPTSPSHLCTPLLHQKTHSQDFVSVNCATNLPLHRVLGQWEKVDSEVSVMRIYFWMVPLASRGDKVFTEVTNGSAFPVALKDKISKGFIFHRVTWTNLMSMV